MKQLGCPSSRHSRCCLPHEISGPTAVSRQAQVMVTRAPALRSITSIKVTIKHGHGFAGGVATQVAAGLLLLAPCTAAALFAQRCSLVGKNLVHRVLKLAWGIHHFPSGWKGWCQNPGTGHLSPAVCRSRPASADHRSHAQPRNIIGWLKGKQSCGAHSIGKPRLNLTEEDNAPKNNQHE